MKQLPILLILFAFMSSNAIAQDKSPNIPDLAQLQKMSARFAPTPLKVDTSKLSAGDRAALVKLIQAARLLNDVFLKQLWSGNPALFAELQKDTTPLGKARLHYFWLNKGPWSDIDEFQAFLPGVPPRKPAGSNFYPEDMTKADFEKWIATLPAPAQEQAKSFFTVLRWQDPATKTSEVHSIQRRIQAGTHARVLSTAGSRRTHRQRQPEKVSDIARRRLPVE